MDNGPPPLSKHKRARSAPQKGKNRAPGGQEARGVYVENLAFLLSLPPRPTTYDDRPSTTTLRIHKHDPHPSRSPHPLNPSSPHRPVAEAGSFGLWPLAALILTCLLSAGSAAAKDPAPPADEHLTPWLDSLHRAHVQAQRRRAPVVVRAGAEWCSFCKELEQQIASEVVQKELQRWVAVAIDVERSPEDARALGVGPVPALRILTSSGRVVASRDGYLSAAEFAVWLKSNYDAAALNVVDELTSSGPPTVASVVRLVKQFQHRDATVREAAVSRLLAHPDSAANQVVASFQEGPLATRLASLELLSAWNAPVTGIDPWVPDTLSDERLQALAAWARGADQRAPDAPEDDLPLSAQELTDIRRELRLMLRGDLAEAAAVRERLARYGRRLLPFVYAELSEQPDDQAREQLTALRYRLVAAPEIVFQWPGGLERLGATDLPSRAAAADELAARAGPSDEALLLELFSDPAPLIREISLRALRKVAGTSAGSALIRLLEDPDPNVRAAVLKQLAETPSPALVPRIAEYVTREQDADLVVHAVRFLREASGQAALETLLTLFSLPSWRVRAEAAEAASKAIGRHSNLGEADKADAYVALVELLEDEDSFVVSRAVGALAEADLVTAVEPLVATAGRHPDLADEVVSALSRGTNQQAKALPHLRAFCQHELPVVRAAAIGGLCRVVPSGAQVELAATLSDADPRVRIAAADAVFSLMTTETDQHLAQSHGLTTTVDLPVPPFQPPPATNALQQFFEGLLGLGRPQAPPAVMNKPPITNVAPAAVPAPDQPPPADGGDTPADDPPPLSGAAADAVLAQIRDGKLLPPWMHDMRQRLTPLLRAEGQDERIAGARPLALLGESAALPELQAAAGAATWAARVSPVLPYVPWTERESLFRRIVSARPAVEVLGDAAGSLLQTPHEAALPVVWELLAAADAGARLVNGLMYPLRRGYFGDHSYNVSNLPPAARRRAMADLVERAASGARWQRTAALVVLRELDPEKTAELARSVVDAGDTDPALRADAFQLQLKVQSDVAGTTAAVSSLNSADDSLRPVALAYLVFGKDSLTALPGGVHLTEYEPAYGFAGERTEPVLPEPPEGLRPETLLPLLASDDPLLAAQAGYLLVLLEREEGLPPLLAYWERGSRNDHRLTQLVYRAVALLDDQDRVPLLSAIYERMRKDNATQDIRDFYWTMRGMTGPDALALRKRVRDDVGMENLR